MPIFRKFKRSEKKDPKKCNIQKIVTESEIDFIVDFEMLPNIEEVLSTSSGSMALNHQMQIAVFVYSKEDSIYFVYDDADAYKKNVSDALLLAHSQDKEIVKIKSSCDFIAELYSKYSEIDKDDKRFIGKLDLWFQETIADAVLAKASDIHILAEDGRTTKVKFRVNGDLMIYKNFPEKQTEELFITIFNNYLSSGERDGSFLRSLIIDSKIEREFELVSSKIGNKKYSLRYSSANRTNNGCSVVLRLLDAEGTKHFSSLMDLGYNKYINDALIPILRSSIGGVYIVGPTGSGKSLTLKTMLDLIGDYHSGRKNIMTVEDPPEYRMKHASQQPVLHKVKDGTQKRKENYLNAIRSVVRQDPDVVMLGEIRDKESAEMALTLTMTGHLMLTTTHVTNTSLLFARLVNEFNIPSNSLAMEDMVKAVLSQRLVKVLCPHCKLNLDEALEGINKKHLLAIKSMFRDEFHNFRFTNKKGCDKCKEGVLGRTAVCELLIPDDTYLEFIKESNFKGATDYWYSSKGGDGFTGINYVDDAVLKAINGDIDITYINDNLKPILDSYYNDKSLSILERV